MMDRTLTTVDVSSLQADGDLLEFDYIDPFGQPARGFVFRWMGELYAYRNLCPHWSVRLDARGTFFDPSGSLLMCYRHGAQFDPTTGECLMGPPEGICLEAFDLEPDEQGDTVTVSRRSSKLSLGF